MAKKTKATGKARVKTKFGTLKVNTNTVKDNSVLSGRQQLKMEKVRAGSKYAGQKQTQRQKTFRTGMRMNAVSEVGKEIYDNDGNMNSLAQLNAILDPSKNANPEIESTGNGTAGKAGNSDITDPYS